MAHVLYYASVTDGPLKRPDLYKQFESLLFFVIETSPLMAYKSNPDDLC